MTELPDDGLCRESSGFLFTHRCDRLSVQQCLICGKFICHDHGHEAEGGMACTTCVKRGLHTPPAAVPRDAVPRDAVPPGTAVDPAAAPNPGAKPVSTYNDPYFYGSSMYPGYGYGGRGYGYSHSHSSHSTHSSGHDPHDFTEGDAESLRHEGDEGFESDMGGS